MNCTNCGQVVPAGATACPNCGTAVAAASTGAATAAAPASGSAGASKGSLPSYKFNTANLTRADWITGIASFVLLIALFLPWFTVSIGGLSGSASGVSGHGWLYLVFLLCLVIIAYEIMKLGWGRLPFNVPLNEERLMLIITVVNLVLVVIGFLFKAYTGASFVDVKIGWGFGAFLGLIAAIVAAAPLVVPAVQARRK